MDITHIEHIGIAVLNLEKAITYYEKVLGLKCYAIETVKKQKVKTAFFKVGETKIELLESTDKESPISKFIEKKGEGIHHIAFHVNDLKKALNEADKKGVRLINKEPVNGAENMSVGFLHPKSTHGVLTELCSKQK